MPNEPTILIPAAGLGRRMKSYGPKSAIRITPEETIVGRQLRLLSKSHPTSPIIIVLGFEADKVNKLLPPSVKTVLNNQYLTTNVAYSLSLGLAACNTDSVLIIYGDLVFNYDTIHTFSTCFDKSVVGIAPIKENEVGVTHIDGYATRFAYGLKDKWSQILFLTGKELELFKKVAGAPDKTRYYGFEILNIIMEMGGNIQTIEHNFNSKIIDVDSSNDIELAKDMFNEDDVYLHGLRTILC